jgi:nitrogen fixation protein FixH
MSARAAEPPRAARWIPWTIVSAFLLIVVANVVMVTLAVRSDPGLVAGAPARLGTGNVLPPATGLQLDVRETGDGGPVEALLRDRAGRPMPAAAVTGVVQRATDARADAAVSFAQAQADAPWRAALPELPAGAWDVALHAYDADGRILATATLRLRR